MRKQMWRIGKNLFLFQNPNIRYSHITAIKKAAETSVVSQNSLVDPVDFQILQDENNTSENAPYINPLSSKVDGEYIDLIAPPLGKALCLAAFVNHSKTLQKLLALGVDLSKVEKTGCAEFLLRSNFEKDLKKHIFFLHEIGVYPKEMGRFLSANPLIFQESIDNLKVRIDYLKSKKFNREAISQIINTAPKFLMLDTLKMDQQLGFIQNMFSLNGKEVRTVTTREPRLVLKEPFKIKENNFVIKEEMGFDDFEIKQLVLEAPKLWLIQRKSLLERFDYIHNSMCIPHSQIVLYPHVLFFRLFNIRERHLYLRHLGRAQYDPRKPGYVSLQLFTANTDQEFCEKAACTYTEDFNKFLKTL
ncbi:transcription termination factor 3, mitochondrial-like [Centruroides sculpturatus]|uniref:transcription termination factor 3, mitochondrial-like n=1 Tax=Centruroides sculpturatus TaxID=218467 RepID=UPI000C6CD415|nr:transcription termination factor 3, mitochondrial-like [Centruroides sculpturatus]XP_023222363.1 transcription termination factor 3, mitochondrial-like [Centruroides sculpturatus]XP_023222368.1 transcription termination factor 3, mitochondrial-like [Centruroides sculpturatus]XP_023222378.1 transcription termination factor 3, mitochondrial-like [Centruroides sculpturatus]XP_023222385.1 transcription termination factor 3, mitochondrial-like [Centruroides sculpturatus]